MVETRNLSVERRKIVFLSSSFVNLAKLFAASNSDFDVFLVLDRKFPFDIEDSELDNFYSFVFDKSKLFERDCNAYFDNLGVFLEEFKPDFVVCSNYTKLLSRSFVEFMKFRNSKCEILNVHHGDLRVIENGEMKYAGLSCDVKEFIEDGKIVSTIHKIENEGMDSGEQLAYSYETSLKELKQRGFLNKREDIVSLRVRNVVISYHERTKVLKLLRKVLDGF